MINSTPMFHAAEGSSGWGWEARQKASHGPGSPHLFEAVARACSRIAPLWPLKHFVAVNPFLGLADQSFDQVCRLMQRVGSGEMLMPAEFYRDQVRQGAITLGDVQRAWQLAPPAMPCPESIEALLELLGARAGAVKAPAVATVADVIDARFDTGWADFVVNEISKWCAAYFDEGQSSWQMPWRGLPLYTAWKRAATLDLNPEAAGLEGFRDLVADLPEQPWDTIRLVLSGLDLEPEQLVDFLHRQLMTIGGWSAYTQYRVREAGLRGEEDDTLIQLLAVRLAWDHVLRLIYAVQGLPRIRWPQSEPLIGRLAEQSLVLRSAMQLAYEIAGQRHLTDLLSEGASPASPERAARKAVQAVFCIDVRSEVYRRCLESVTGEIETAGFAGFFGFPIEYIPLGHAHGSAHCPVLISPKYRIRETVKDASVQEVMGVLHKRWSRKRAAKLWKSFKASAVSCFAYVEIAGLFFGFKLVSDSLGLTRPVSHPALAGLDKSVAGRVGPTVARQRGRLVRGGAVVESGMALGERVELARKALQGMGLTKDFARLVLLCGHGSRTVNNPYGSGLDCGACGGHAGEANARVAAAVLNDREVRLMLAEQGLPIPQDTWFVAGLHDTTTEAVQLFDQDAVPRSHEPDLARLHDWLRAASSMARSQRAAGFGLAAESSASLAAKAAQRSRDWSQVRPEWGLAGNCAFVAAPRRRTAQIDLQGRVFLHNYDFTQDHDGAVLELIMTAPMVVASWINLQYYASTVDNRLFGSGNKVIHNVVGTLGVLQGNGGDLQVGLPWQSLHDGSRLVHEPKRLSVYIEAPRAAIESVIARHPAVRQLVENRWLHLFRLEPGSAGYERYTVDGLWLAESMTHEEA